MEHERKSFLFYGSYLDAVERLKDKDVKLELMLAIAHYGLDRKVPKFSNDLAAMAWVFIEPLLDANYKNYINGCRGGAPSESMKENKNAKKTNPKQTENKPKTNPKQTENKPKTNPKQTENKGNDNDNVNVNANDNDNATDNDNANANDNDNDNDNVNDNIENSIFPTDGEKVTDDDFYEIWQRDDGVWMGGDIPMEERLKMEKEEQQNV